MFPNKNEFEPLKAFFEPEAIALIGASNDPRKPSGRPLHALIDKGYKGKIYPVNPKYESISGIKCYPTLASIPGPVDLAVISVPAAGVYNTLEQCVEKGVKGAIIFSSGFAEVGPQGQQEQRKITELARRSGLRLCGPNCLGVVNTTNGVMASFAFIVNIPDIDPRTVGFVTQSGAFGALIYAQALYSGIGLSYFVSVGNEADLEFADFLGYMVHDDKTRVLGGYLEGAKDGRLMRRVANEAAKVGKPIMIMKVGRSSTGARAASSHTGSLAGEDRIYDAFFKQTGIIRIDGPEELISFVPIISAGRLPKGRNVAVLTVSGGAGVTLADMSERLGLTLPPFSEEAVAKMEAALPFFASAQNPIDLTAQYVTNPEMLMTCFEALLKEDNIDIILGNFDFREPYGVEIARKVIEYYNSTDKTMVMCPWVFPGQEEEEGIKELRRAGVPVLLNTAQAVRAIAHLADYAEFLRKRQKAEYAVPDAPGLEEDMRNLKGALSEGQSKDILAKFGIPVTAGGIANSEEEAVALAERIGYPVAVKIDSPDILHKTEAGAIALNLKSAEEVKVAYHKVLQNANQYKPGAGINGVLVQEMLPEGTEVIIGVTRDPVFGPTVMFGLGGIFVEVLKDVSFRVAPLSPGDAMDMIKEIKGYQLLKGVRGKQPADINALADVIMKVSNLAVALGDNIKELDINPLIVYPERMGVKAADAVIVFKE
ncbi:acetate--CoA ligase family protein [Desulfotruncus alcoholivorax]|uniref:acetate--CoA ligase family protein n=1 Tax=Desulfotruncus alcoholivorax TaxID=265477 RepID=UPI0004251709|nr:acetate--CoA ligase family protein [Desulfotruncus alcoholivorax]